MKLPYANHCEICNVSIDHFHLIAYLLLIQLVLYQKHVCLILPQNVHHLHTPLSPQPVRTKSVNKHGGRSHTRVVYKRANQGLEDNQLQSCRNGSRVSCGISRCLVPQYSCWYALNVCSFCLSIKFKVTDISHEIALCKPLCDL